MGVDAVIFDRKSKDCLYFDRLTNLYSYCDDNYGLLDSLQRKGASVPSAEVVRGMNAALANLERADRSNSWTKAIRDFAQQRPHGEFFVVSDHDDPPFYDFLVEYGGAYTPVKEI